MKLIDKDKQPEKRLIRSEGQNKMNLSQYEFQAGTDRIRVKRCQTERNSENIR